MFIVLNTTRSLTLSEVADSLKTLFRMQNRGNGGKNTVNLSNINVTTSGASFTIIAHNQQTSGQIKGSVKGALGKSIGKGIFM